MLFSVPKRFEQTSEDGDGDTEDVGDGAVEVTRKKVLPKRPAQQVSTMCYFCSFVTFILAYPCVYMSSFVSHAVYLQDMRRTCVYSREVEQTEQMFSEEVTQEDGVSERQELKEAVIEVRMTCYKLKN